MSHEVMPTMHQPKKMGIFASITSIFNSTAGIVTQTARTLERGAHTIDVLIESGEILAESQNRKIRYTTMGEEQEAINYMKERYPGVDFANYTPPELDIK